MAALVHARVVDVEIDMAAAVRLVSGPACGAIATFAGVVRDHDHGRRVVELEYVAHDSADRVIGEIAGSVAERHVHLTALAVVHRAGLLRVGGIAVVVATASVHRADALLACSEAIEEVKKRLPVWKRQVFADGTEEWVNCS